MSANPSFPLRLRKLLFIALLFLICALIIYWLTQENKPWSVPPEYKALKNPLVPSQSNLNFAKQIYADECAECHGETGKGDGPEARTHYPLPADLTDAKLLANVTDGEIFYQISEGRRPMPSFKRRLTQDQRWQLVLFVRSFSQSPEPAKPGENKRP
jgi:mono/diheme cytochrome c family protein